MGLNAYTKPKKSLLSRNVEEKSAQTTHSLKRKRQQQLLLPLLNPNSGKHLMGKCLMGKSLGKYLRANVLSANVELPYSRNLKTCNLTKCALFVLGLYTVCHSVTVSHASYMRHGLSSLKIGCRKQEIALLVHADFLLSVDSKELFDPSKASMTQLMTIIFVTCVMWSQV
jgi:hypothetical protein